MSGRAGGWPAALAALALGCASPGVVVDPCAGRGGPGTGRVEAVLELDAWQRAALPHVTVYSVAGAEAPRRAARRIEAFMALASGLVSSDGFSAARPVVVYRFAREEQLHHFVSCQAAGHTVAGDRGFTAALEAGFERADVIQHELVHVVLLDRADVGYPPWFHEGLAQLLGSAVIRSGVATVGAKPPGVHFLARLEPLPLAEVLSSGSAVRSDAVDTQRFYLEAWAFVHYGLLSHGMGGPRRAPQLMAFVRAVGRGEPWRTSLERAFGAPLESVEAEYREHRRLLLESPIHPVAHLRFAPAEAAVRFEPVGETEMARRLGEHALDVERGDLAAALFDHALEAEPDDSAALLGRLRAAALQREFARADALWSRVPAAERETVEGWQAAATLARARYAALDEAARREAGSGLLARARAGYEQVLRASPRRRSALVGLGETYVLEPDASDVERGIAALREAVRAFPHDPHVRVDLGALHLRAGDPGRARSHLRYVIEAFPRSESSERAEELLDRIPDPA